MANRRREGPNEKESEAIMSLEDAMRQKSVQMELSLEFKGEAQDSQRSGEASTVKNEIERLGTGRLMEEAVGSANVEMALKQVRRNKGGPGVDGMTADELPHYVAQRWTELRAELLAGTYQPKPVKRQVIDKEDGGVRILGIPCVLDLCRSVK